MNRNGDTCELESFKSIPTTFPFFVQVNEFGDVFAFQRFPGVGTRIFCAPHQMVAVNIYGNQTVRPLTDKEILFLEIYPNGLELL